MDWGFVPGPATRCARDPMLNLNALTYMEIENEQPGSGICGFLDYCGRLKNRYYRRFDNYHTHPHCCLWKRILAGRCFGAGFLGFYVFLYIILPAVGVVIFWVCKSATPGKMATKLTIVDAKSGDKPSTGQFVIRYLGYYVSALPLLPGFIWVGIDKLKQGWHDKLAGTVDLRNTKTEPVKFEVQV